jgi:hypothetical protein
MGLRIEIPSQMPRYIPKTYLGMPPLPFTNTEPFKAAKIKPEGGITRATIISGVGNGGFKLNTVKRSSSGNRKTNRKSSKSSTANKGTQTKKSKKRSNAKLLAGNGKKKTGIFQKVVKSGKKFLAKSIPGKGGQKKLKRNKNGRFSK